MGTGWVDGLKVADLKAELRGRGLPVGGTKLVLAARLKEAVEAEEAGGESSKEPSPAVEDAVDAAAAEGKPEGAEEPDSADQQVTDTAAAAEAAAAAVAVAADVSAVQVEMAVPVAEAAAAEVQPASGPAQPAAPESAAEQPEEPQDLAEPDEQQPKTEHAAEAADIKPAQAVPPVSPLGGPQEDLLDFEDQDTLELEAEQQGTPPGDAVADGAAAMEADEPTAAARADKRPAEELQEQEPDAANTPAQAELEEPHVKRSKRTPIPRPEETWGPRQPADAYAGSGTGGKATRPANVATPVAADAPASSSGSERKRKHAPIPIPTGRSGSRDLAKQTSSAAAVAEAATAEPNADQETAVAKALEAAGELSAEATAALRITGLKRPLTANSLIQKLSETGVVVAMQLTTIRDKAWVIFKERSHAHATRHALQGKEWPEGNKSRIALQFIPVELAQYAVDHNVQKEPTAAEVARILKHNSGAAMPTAAVGTAAGEREGSAGAAAGEAAAVDDAPAAAETPEDGAAAPVTKAGAVRGRGMPTAAAVEAAAAAAAAAAEAEQQKQKQQQQRKPVNEPLTLDDLFRKTITKPNLYYLPLTDEQVAAKKQRLSRGDSAGGAAAAAAGGQADSVGPAVQEGLAPSHANKH